MLKTVGGADAGPVLKREGKHGQTILDSVLDKSRYPWMAASPEVGGLFVKPAGAFQVRGGKYLPDTGGDLAALLAGNQAGGVLGEVELAALPAGSLKVPFYRCLDATVIIRSHQHDTF